MEPLEAQCFSIFSVLKMIFMAFQRCSCLWVHFVIVGVLNDDEFCISVERVVSLSIVFRSHSKPSALNKKSILFLDNESDSCPSGISYWEKSLIFSVLWDMKLKATLNTKHPNYRHTQSESDSWSRNSIDFSI